MKRYSVWAVLVVSLCFCSVTFAQSIPVDTKTPTAKVPSGEKPSDVDDSKPKQFSPESPYLRSKTIPKSTAETPAPNEQPAAPETPPTDEAPAPEAETSDTTSTKEPSSTDANAVESGAAAMMAGDGATSQIPGLNSLSVQVQPYTGSASVPIPISVPPGRAGIQPSIALVYNSGSPESFTGVGWNLDLGSIQRSTKKGPPKYNATDTFVLMQSGSSSNLVYDSSVSYYRQEIDGAFAKITSSGSGSSMTWVMTDKKGTKYFFGQTAVSQQADPADSTKIFEWALDRVEDINGNYMTITYIKHGNSLYPDTIQYTGETSPVIAPFAKVVFTYTDVTRVLQSYRSSFLVTSSKLLDEVKVYGNNVLMSKYKLTYTQSGNSKRYLLSTLKQYGADGTSTLPTVTFTYQGTEKGFTDPPETNWTIPSNSSFVYLESNGKWTDRGVRVADVNGDAYPDLVRSFRACGDTYTVSETYLNTKTEGFQLTTGSAWNVPEPAKGFLRSCNEADYSWGLQLADIDGDMWVDLIRNYKRDPSLGGTFYRQTFLNDEVGSFGSEVAAWAPPTNTAVIWQKGVGPGTEYSEYHGVVYADVNGDSYTDIVISKFDPDRNNNVYINQAVNGGTGWVLDPAWTTPVEYYSSFAAESVLMDLNGDGLPDIIHLGGQTNSKVFMNTGHGFAPPDQASPWSNLPSSLIQLATGTVQVADINGDGLTDIIIGNGGYVQVYINTGAGWFDDHAAWEAPSGYFARQDQRLLDANADGMMDYVYHIAGFVAEVYVNEGKPADLLVKIENGVGGTTEIAYDSSAHYTNTFLPFIVQVVKSVKVSTATENFTTDYSYANGLWAADGREFRGFGQVTVTDPDGNYTKTNYLQDKIYKGMVSSQETYDSANALFAKTVNTWDKKTLIAGDVSVFPYLKRVDNYLYDGTATDRRTAQEFFYDETTQYGNLTKTIEYGEVNLSTGADTGSDKRTTESTYVNNSTLWLLGLPSQVTIKDNAGTQVRLTSFYYDNNTTLTGTLTKGLLTKRVRWNGTGNPTPTDLYSYDTSGNLSTTTDPLNNVTTITYDPLKLFPLTTTNALSQVVTTEYYGINSVALNDGAGLVGLWGQVKSVKDANNQKAYRVYDTFGRMIKSISPLDSVAFPTTIMEYTYGADYLSVKTRARRNSGVAGVVDAVQFYDGLGRLIQTKTKDITANQYVVSGQTQYTSRGLPQYKYLPRFTSNDLTVIDAVDTSKPRVTLLYDAMGRLIRTTNPDATYSNTVYMGWLTRQYDERGARNDYTYDAYGRVKKVEEYGGYDGRSSVYPAIAYYVHATTNYTYDSEGNLKTVTDNASNVTTINYDNLGRKTSMDDPDMGVWSYTYDLNGNLKTQTDAKSQVMTFNYDALNRLTTKTGTGLSVTYTYDDTVNSGFAKGRLSKVDYTGGSTRFVYDALGRETSSTKTIDGTNYTVSRVYDAMNNVTKVTYPDLSEVFYQFNTVGQLQAVSNSASVLPPLVSNHQPSPINDQPFMTMLAKLKNAASSFYASVIEPKLLGVKEAEAAAPPTLFVSNITYNANGQALVVTYGNGTVTTNTYNSPMFRLNRIRTVKGATVLQDLTYTYDPIGNIRTIADAVNTADQSFTYDHRNRLASATGQTYGAYTYGYSSIANITSKEGVSFTYSGVNAGPHAVTSLSDGTAMTYDLNGNMATMNKTGDNKTFTYNIENRLTGVTKNGTALSSYVYDGDGGRTKKSVTISGTTTTTTYIGSLTEITGANATNHIYLGSQQIASITNSAVTYVYQDHLGGANVTTDSAGTVKEITEYKPFGGFARNDKYGSSQEVAWFYFTGKKLDDETGLYYYGARYYSPIIGKFITPDSIVQSPMDPQTLNRYSYCNNNAINFIDPDGHSWKSFWKGFKKVASYILGGALGAPYVQAAFEGNWALVGKGVLNVLGLVSGNPFFMISGGLSVLSDNAAYYGYNDASRTLGYVALGFAAVGTGVEITRFLTSAATSPASTGVATEASESVNYQLSSLSADELMSVYDEVRFSQLVNSSSAEMGKIQGLINPSIFEDPILLFGGVKAAGVALKGGFSMARAGLSNGLNGLRNFNSQVGKVGSARVFRSGGQKSVFQLNKLISQSSKVPKTIMRFDGGQEMLHVHFSDQAALYANGVWKHGSRALSNREKDFLVNQAGFKLQ